MIKKIFFLAAIAFVVTSFGQTRTMNFETGNFASVLEKAKKENKHVFIDGYTTWCGPCKMMTKNTFTNDSVADFYNAKFVNFKLDMEKGEGPEFAKKYEVNCYPNLLILNADGKVIHRSAGYLEPKTFLTFGRTAFVPGKTFTDQKTSFEKNLNEKNIQDYIQLIGTACFNSSPYVLDYLKSLKETDLVKPVNFGIIDEFVTDYNSREAQHLIKNNALYEKQNNKAQVERKITSLGVNWFEPHFGKNFNKESFEKAKTEFAQLKWPYSDHILFEAELIAVNNHDKKRFFDLASAGYLKYNSNKANALNSMAWKFYEEVDEKEQLKSAVAMAKRACELEGHYANLDTYAAVLYKSGNYKEADKIVSKAIETAKKEKMAPADYKETTDLQNKIKAKLK